MQRFRMLQEKGYTQWGNYCAEGDINRRGLHRVAALSRPPAAAASRIRIWQSARGCIVERADRLSRAPASLSQLDAREVALRLNATGWPSGPVCAASFCAAASGAPSSCGADAGARRMCSSRSAEVTMLQCRTLGVGLGSGKS